MSTSSLPPATHLACCNPLSAPKPIKHATYGWSFVLDGSASTVSRTPPSPCARENNNLIYQLMIKPPLHFKPKGSRQLQSYSNMLGIYSENIVSTSLHLSSKNKWQWRFNPWRIKPPCHVLINYIHHPSIIKHNPFMQYRTWTTDALKILSEYSTLWLKSNPVAIVELQNLVQ